MIVILCGPSGVGKSYVMNCFVKDLGFKFPVPHTTRKKRLNEVDGNDYFFTSLENAKKISYNFSIGYWANPIGDDWYGYTDSIDDFIKTENNIILIMQTKLAKVFLQTHSEAVCFFLGYSTPMVMRKRIIERTNNIEDYNNRMLFSLNEIINMNDFDYVYTSDNPNDFVKYIKDTLRI